MQTTKLEIDQIADQDTGRGFVKRKIKRAAPPKDALVARARKEQWPVSLAKVIKKAVSISELMTEEDAKENVRVLREAKKATHRIYDAEQGKLIEVPDHKTRLAAITLELAYREGRPVERQIQLQRNVGGLAETLEAANNSPEMQAILAAMNSLPAGSGFASQSPPIREIEAE